MTHLPWDFGFLAEERIAARIETVKSACGRRVSADAISDAADCPRCQRAKAARDAALRVINAAAAAALDGVRR